MTAEPQVKSLTFVTLRETLGSVFVEQRGADTLEGVFRAMRPDAREVLETVEPGEWVPERQMFEALRTVFEVGFDGDRERYVRFIHELSARGITRFLSIILNLVSARFVLLRVPAVWAHMRRNAGTVVASRHEGGVRLEYSDFPFFGHEAYRMLSFANCQALVRAATGSLPEGKVVRWTNSSLELQFELEAR